MVTIGFMPHQLEILSLLEERLNRHSVIILEEPTSSLFDAMLREELSIEEYLQDIDSQFPQFETALCAMARDLNHRGKTFLQIDPYMDVLGSIHEHFADGGTKEALLKDFAMKPVYEAEREATGRLIQFYHHSSVRPFEEVVASVAAFAWADAKRIVLRDRMRAEKIAGVWKPGASTFIETGYIHFTLYKHLRARLPQGARLRADFLLAPAIRSFGGKRRNLSPGDVLTLNFTLGAELPLQSRKLLAARSLIYIKMIRKEEVPAEAGRYPLTEHEVLVNRTVDRLSYRDCEILFEKIKHRKPGAACELVLGHLDAGREE